MDTQSADLLAQELEAVREAWGPFLIRLQTKAGRILGIQKLMYTYALLADITPSGYGDRWCYHGLETVLFHFEAWTGEEGTEPQGWHRAIDGTGRRRHADGREYIMP